MDTTKKSGRGGRREGAGRPKGDSRLFTFRAAGQLADYIEAHANKSRFITDCITQVRDGEEQLRRLGDVYAATSVVPLTLPSFDLRVVAGFPIPLDNDERAQDIDLLRMLCPNPEASYLIRVQGDSMIDADIHTGDILVVDKSNRNPGRHEVALCELNGDYTIKYVERRADGLWLVPANADFPEIPVREGDAFSVWGIVTFVIHRPRH